MANTPKDVLAEIKKAKEQNLTTLVLILSGLTEVPKEIAELTNLTTLELGGNDLTTLPEFLGQMTHLTRLGLGSNGLTTLPEVLGRMTSLTWLELYGNGLKTLPEFLGRMTNLTTLGLGANGLTTLPEFLGRLTNLTRLDLGSNGLTALPEFLGRLTNLTTLNLSRNGLTALPEFLGNLTNLTELNVGSNGLKMLPEFLFRLPKMRSLYVSGNPVESPPPELLELKEYQTTDLTKVRKYFDQLEAEGKDYLYEAKLLIVGEPEAGKTTLAKKIEDPKYELQHQITTRGIVVKPWKFKTPDGHDFRLNIWDFGGQEIYKATHQFFLTKRSLYALVVDDRKEDTDFYYWMNVVDLLSEGSPVLIIKNEKENRQRAIPESQLRERFSNLKEILPTNFAETRGFKEILQSIQHFATKLPHIGTPLPKTWVKVRKALEDEKRNYIGFEEYLEICDRNEFKKREEQLQLSEYLHDLGVCLHFQKDPVLCKTVILKPKWGTDAVYKALDNEKVVKNQGKFTRDDLKHIWSEPEYRDMHNELLQLMVNFKLCYQIPNKQEFIAPQLLTEDKSEYKWDETDNLLMRFTYEFMPKGILTQFIVAMHPHIADQSLVWRSGVVIDRDRTRAEVIEYYDKRMITIRVSGERKRDLMTIVSYKLEEVHAAFKNPKSKQLIPCNCVKCKGNQQPHFYEFESLMRRIEARRYEVECDVSYDKVDVWGLIDDVYGKARFLKQYEGEHPRGKLSHRPILPELEESEIYISYKWGGESDKIADRIESEFTKRNIRIHRDRNDIEYTGSIEKYMEEIGAGKCVVIILSDGYLKSDNCMFELLEVFRRGNARKRVLPVVLSDAKIYSPAESIGYKNFWDKKTDDLAKQIKESPSQYGMEKYDKYLDRYNLIRTELGKLTDTLKDMNALTLGEHIESGFNELIRAVEKRLAEP